MTAISQPESKFPSRRALLAGALGGIGALAATVIGRASPARAEGETVVVGGEYLLATSRTIIANYTNTCDVASRITAEILNGGAVSRRRLTTEHHV